MQDFHPDCTINLFIHSFAKGAKVYWSCSLVTRKSVRILAAEKLFGTKSKDLAEWTALEFGLLSAKRLKQEKIAVATNFLSEKELLEPRKLRDPELQSIKAQCQKLYLEFRLKKIQSMDEGEKKYFVDRVEEMFSRGKKRD